MSGYHADDIMVIDHQLWDSVIKRLDCIEESLTHANLRIHMLEKWIAEKWPTRTSRSSAMKALVEFCIAVTPESEMEKILSGKVRPPQEDIPK